MSDLNQTPNPVPAPGPEPTPTPQADARAAIQERYNTLYAAPAPEPTPEPTPDPVAPEPSAVPEPPAPEVSTVLSAIMDRLAQLETRQAPAAPAPVQPPAPGEPPKDWLELLSSGDKAAAEQRLREQLGVPDQAVVIRQAVEQMRVEHELSEFTRNTQAANADIASMEPYVAAAVAADLQAQFNGKNPGPTEYAEAYKTSVTNHITKARNLVLEFRGQGVNQATTRTTQVLAQPTLVPQPVTTVRETPPGSPAPESTSDYLAKRQILQAQTRGLAPRT